MYVKICRALNNYSVYQFLHLVKLEGACRLLRKMISYTYPICFNNSCLWGGSVQCPLAHPTIKPFKWKHPCAIDRPKLIYSFGYVPHQMHRNDLENINYVAK